MSQANSSPHRAVPPWILVTVAIVGVVLVGFFGWRAIAGYAPEAGPPTKVYPHMYDLRAEVAKRNGQQQTGAAQHGP